jgi:hypothetical protein
LTAVRLAPYDASNRFCIHAWGVPVSQMIVEDREMDDVALIGVAVPAVLDVVAIIIIDGIILLTGET